MRGMVLFFLFVLTLLLLPATARAQSAIVVGPSSVLAWEVVTPDVATARTLTIAATVDGGATPVTLTLINCGPGPAGSPTGTFTCSSPLSQIPTGSHALTLTATLNSVTSVPSTSFAYIDFLIPVPANVRAK
jgi:hypothetical protein